MNKNNDNKAVRLINLSFSIFYTIINGAKIMPAKIKKHSLDKYQGGSS